MAAFVGGTILTASALNNAINQLAGQTVALTSPAAATVPFTVTGAASQSANLAELKSSAGTIVASISVAGVVTANGSGLTNLNASNLASGTVPSVRVSGSYAGITAVGTLTGVTSSSRVWAQTDLRVGNSTSTVVSSDLYALIVTPQAYTGLPVRIGEHYSIASVGSQNSQFTVFAGPASGGEVIIKRAANTTIASFQQNGLYLSEGWLRTYGARGWYSETYGGGIYMDDTSTVKVYNGKAFYAPSSISSGSNISAAGSVSSGGMMGVSGAGIAYYGATVGGGSPNQIGFRWANPVVNCTVDNVISAVAANFSDRRLKTDIVPFVDGIDMVRRLRPVRYNPLDVVGFDSETFEPIIGDLEPHDEMLGFVADEVQDVYSNAVRGKEKEIKSIDTVQLLSMAISAIRDLDNRLANLEGAAQ
jgi:hypothetical protein